MSAPHPHAQKVVDLVQAAIEKNFVRARALDTLRESLRSLPTAFHERNQRFAAEAHINPRAAPDAARSLARLYRSQHWIATRSDDVFAPLGEGARDAALEIRNDVRAEIRRVHGHSADGFLRAAAAYDAFARKLEGN